MSKQEILNYLNNKTGNHDFDNNKQKKEFFHNLVDKLFETKKEDRNEQDFKIKNEIFCLEPKENTNFKKDMKDHKKILVFIGDPNKDGKFDFFCIKQYFPLSMEQDSHNSGQMKYLEEMLENSFDGDNMFFMIHSNQFVTKNKKNFFYKTYDDVIETAKKFFGIEYNEKVFVPSVNSSDNYNNLVSIFNDQVALIYKAFKIY